MSSSSPPARTSPTSRRAITSRNGRSSIRRVSWISCCGAWDLLGPDPGGLAIWTFADYAAAEPIVRERHGGNPLRPLQAGLYYDFEEALI